MYIRRISITDFMPYAGEVHVEFPSRSGASLFPIVGENMRGKTSFLNSIRWALYGEALGRHGRKIHRRDLVNRDAAAENRWETQVELEFEHQGKVHRIRRKLLRKDIVASPDQDEHFDEFFSHDLDGATLSKDQSDRSLQRILAKNLSHFYLFDGEQLQEYEDLLDKNGKGVSTLKTEIENLLGMPTLSKGLKVISSLLDKVNKDIGKQEQDNKLLRVYTKKSDQLRQDKSTVQLEVDSLNQNIQELNAKIAKGEESLKRNEAVLDIYKKISSLEGKQDLIKEDLERNKQAYFGFSEQFWKIALAPAVSKLAESLEPYESLAEDSPGTALIPQVRQVVAKHALQSDACPLCEQPLSKDANKLFKASIASSNEFTESSDNATATLLSRTRAIKAIDARGSFDRLKGIHEEIARLDLNLFDIEDKIRAERESIRDIDSAEVARTENRVDKWRVALGEANVLLTQKLLQLEEIDDEISKLSRQIIHGGGGDAILQKKYAILEHLRTIFSNGIEQLKDSLRSEVESNASSAFLKMTSEKDYTKLVITEHYGLEIVDENNRIVAERSAGAEQVVALSLIDGLNKTAGKNAPIVMDTPFGRLDKKHRRNVLRYLPSMSEQVVLLVHEGELDLSNDLKEVSSNIGRTFRIERVSSSQSTIKIED